MLAAAQPYPQYFDVDGKPLDGGAIFYGAANADPESSPVTVYWDAAGTQPAAQPIPTLAGFPVRAGTPAAVYVSGDYSLRVRNRQGVQVLHCQSAATASQSLAIQQALATAAASKGASLVAYLAGGSGARSDLTVEQKLREFASITDYPGAFDGVSDDTTAATRALAAAQWVHVPAGAHVCVSGSLDLWRFFGPGRLCSNGVDWELCPFPQSGGTVKAYKPRTFGTRENAVGHAVTVNSGVGQTSSNAQVLGTDTVGLAATYTDRDHVGQFISAYSFTPDVLDGTTTYTASTLTNGGVPALNDGTRIKPGMVIDTLHATPYTGRVVSVSGSTITVDGWYLRGTGAAGTPANATGAVVNPNNKIFGQNIVVSAQGNGTTTGAQRLSGVELDLSMPASATPIPGTWGFDLSVLSGYLEIGHQVRGRRSISYYSNNAGGAGDYGLLSKGDGRGVSVQDATAVPIEVIRSGASVFSVGTDGAVNVQGGGLRFIGPLQTTASYVSIGSGWVTGHGALFFVSGYNLSTGAEGKFLLAVNNTGISSILSSDGSGTTVAFQVSGNALQIKATTGTFQFTAWQLLG